MSEQKHYFTDNRNLPSDRKEHSFRFSGHVYSFVTDHGVFSKTGVDQGTEILLDAIKDRELHGSILDLGCGYGVIGIVLAKTYPGCKIDCIDVNARAVELAKENAKRNHVTIQVFESDGYANVPGKYDVVVSNPPIRTGKKIVYGLFEGTYEHLEKDGIFLCVVRKQQGASSAQKKLTEIFGNCNIISKHKGYWVLMSVR